MGKGMFSLLELKTPTDKLQSECDVRFICVKNEKLCKIRKDIIVKNGKKTVTTVSFPFFCILIVENIQKIYFEIMKYIKI